MALFSRVHVDTAECSMRSSFVPAPELICYLNMRHYVSRRTAKYQEIGRLATN